MDSNIVNKLSWNQTHDLGYLLLYMCFSCVILFTVLSRIRKVVRIDRKFSINKRKISVDFLKDDIGFSFDSLSDLID